jgi:hypothetical protein
MGTKIVDLPQIITIDSSDILPISQDNSGTRTTYKVTAQQLASYVANNGGGGGGGTVTSVGFQSSDSSITVTGTTITTTGSFDVRVNNVGLDKLDDGGASNGDALLYDTSTGTWTASSTSGITSNYIHKPTPATNGQVLAYDGSTSTWAASSILTPSSSNTFSAKAWVSFDGTPSTPTIRSSFNVSSVEKVSTGDYRLHFTTPMKDSNYIVLGTCEYLMKVDSGEAPTTSTARVRTTAISPPNLADVAYGYVCIFGL